MRGLFRGLRGWLVVRRQGLLVVDRGRCCRDRAAIHGAVSHPQVVSQRGEAWVVRDARVARAVLQGVREGREEPGVVFAWTRAARWYRTGAGLDDPGSVGQWRDAHLHRGARGDGRPGSGAHASAPRRRRHIDPRPHRSNRVVLRLAASSTLRTLPRSLSRPPRPRLCGSRVQNCVRCSSLELARASEPRHLSVSHSHN